MNDKIKCPLCSHILYKKYIGLVCKNRQCELYWKMGRGWVYHGKESNEDLKFKYRMEAINSIVGQERILKWLEFKRLIIKRDNGKCQKCGSERDIEVHHIINRTEAPELIFDKENCIVLCNLCHTNIHKFDKHHFN